jgi:soluble lytic murein transglycosylase-like protein
MLKKFDGDIEKTLAAYNAGPGNVEQYNGVPPFEETKNYINRVKGYMKFWEDKS